MKIDEAVNALAAVAQESRLGIYRLLVQAGQAGLCAGEIARSMKLAAPTLSFHLAHLKRAGLVSSRRQGTSLIYSADFDAMNTLVRYLTENCCGTGVQCDPVCEPDSAAARRRAG